MRRIIFMGLVFALGACEEGSKPKSGAWEFSAGEQTENTCNYDGVGGRSGTFTVENDGNSLTIDPEDGSDPFDCDMDGNDFDCPERFQGEDELSGYDATLITHVSAQGTFDTNESASGTQHGRVECEGSDCGSLASAVGASLPCEFTERFTAEFAD